MTRMMDDLPKAYGVPELRARFKQSPEDFQVDEVLGIDPSGSGEHWLLHVQKSELNTLDVVNFLARTLGVKAQDIGYCGLKDKQSVSTQWFSVLGGFTHDELGSAFDRFDAERPTSDTGVNDHAEQVLRHPPELRLCQATRHARKLRRGAHRANRFHITLRDVQTRDPSASKDDCLKASAASIVQNGVPNYIGPQRFGINRSNLTRAESWFKHPKKRISRDQRSRYLSTARSELFNAVCAARVSAENWLTPLAGEPLMLDGSRSFFLPEQANRSDSGNNLSLSERIRDADIHTSAPWWGQGEPLAGGHCLEFERQVLNEYPILMRGLESARLPQQRRALRACVRDFTWQWLDTGTVRCSFKLDPGLFATAVLAEYCLLS